MSIRRVATILCASSLVWWGEARADIQPGPDTFRLGQRARIMIDSVSGALALLKGLATASPGRNLILSPVGVTQAGLTAFAGMRSAERNSGPFSANGLKGSFQLKLAMEAANVEDPEAAAAMNLSNALFARGGQDRPSALDVPAARLMFGPILSLPDGRKSYWTVNNWAHTETSGALGALAPALPLRESDYLANVASLRARVLGSEIRPGSFAGEGGKPLPARFATLQGLYNFGRVGGFQAVCLPLGKAKELRLVLFLPDDYRNALTERIPDMEAFFDVIKCLREVKPEMGVVKVPLFSVESHLEVGRELTRLKLSPSEAQPGARLPGWDPDRTFGGILHAARFEVSETRGVPVLTSDGPSLRALEFNRPFLFAIRNDRTHALYLLGVVRNLVR